MPDDGPPREVAVTAAPGTPSVSPQLLRSTCDAYADLLRRQGTAASPFSRWSQTTRRGHVFAWLGHDFGRETLLFTGQPLRVAAGTPLGEAVRAMRTTVTLNPYERDLFYGYPYVIGRRGEDVVRGPLLIMPVRVEGEGAELALLPDDEVVRFNSLPFRTDRETEARELCIRRVMDATPAFPLTPDAFNTFLEIAIHTLGVDRRNAQLDGALAVPPTMPTRGQGLWLVDNAAVFIAPKTAYFLTSDLTRIGEQGPMGLGPSCLAALLARAGAQPQVDVTAHDLDRRRTYYPFPSNRAQRKVAVLLEDATTRVVRVEGPPGTGKSLTIANLACHLAATGKSVIITSQKDKALEVVDEKLRALELPELPMTLLRHDRDSKRDLLDRLARIKKERAREEVEREVSSAAATFTVTGQDYLKTAEDYARAIEGEEQFERAHRQFLASSGIRRLMRRARFVLTRRRVGREAPRTTDELAETGAASRQRLRDLAMQALKLGREHAVAAATREERQGLRELAQILQRNQTAARNFSLFDRLKDDPQRAAMLLKLLPVWIMAPEDVARLFPCTPGLFDVVIVDEASQVDLPSITPIVYRGKKVVIFGDTKQMQPRRFLFMNTAVIMEAWQQHGMDRLDPERWLYPTDTSLLNLATARAEEETLLDEHFRSLPSIIAFSNEEWYGNQLRVMTDERRKVLGTPNSQRSDCNVPDGRISNGSQENQAEAAALVSYLGKMVTSEDYTDASIGVICLFEEQAALVQELVAQHIPEDEWEEHHLVVVTPDGFQGDERDVILYSLSWDNDVMPRQALSQRQRQHPHEQGMLNVAFTRARDEIHVFHSAPIETFTLADGRPGAVTRWLKHCATVQCTGRAAQPNGRVGQVDSEFEAEVATELRARGLLVIHQYPACGFHMDLVCEKDGVRVAVECDGERYHLDEHGQPKLEDLEREAILRRAGWRIVRIPYRKWVRDREGQLRTVLKVLEDEAAVEDAVETTDNLIPGGEPTPSPPSPETVAPPRAHTVTGMQDAIIKALREGFTEEQAVLYRVRDLIGSHRLTARLRVEIIGAAQQLSRLRIVTIEDHEYFLTAEAREAQIHVAYRTPGRPSYRRRR